MILIAIYSIIGDNRMSEFSNSSSYHVSGVPFVKTTANGGDEIDFKYVTKAITIVATNTGTIHFGDADNTTFPLAANQLYRFEVSCINLTITVNSGTASLVAEMSGILADRFTQHDQDDYGTVA